MAGGEDKAKFYLNRSEVGGALKFEERASGLELDKVIGAYPLDVDGDGNQDVVLLRSGENVVMRGLGECRFERANEAWGFDGGDAWSTAFSATWEKGNAWPTLAVGNYIDRFEDLEPWGSCTDNWLHRPVSASERRFAPPAPLNPSYCPLSILFTDWNRSGTPSLRVSNDREYYKGGQEQMWKLPPGGTPELYTQAEGWRYLRIWGMGIASHDLDFDGYPEYFLTSMADNKLQKLAEIPADGKPKPSYADVAFAKGATAHRPYVGGEIRPSTAWHTEFEDVNNDGRTDLFIAKGNVAKMPDFAAKDPNNLLVQGEDGKFIEMGDKAGVASMATGPRRRALRFQPRWPHRSARRQPGLARRDLAQHDGNARPLPAGGTAPGRPEPGRHRRLDRGEDRRLYPAPRNHHRRRPCQRQDRLAPFRSG